MLFVLPTASELTKIVANNAKYSNDWAAFKNLTEGCELQIDIFHFTEVKKFVIQLNAMRGFDLVTFIKSELLEDDANSVCITFHKPDLWHFDM